MLQVYGFIEEPKLLVHHRGKSVVPTQLAQHLRDTQDGLLVAAIVALHENSKVKLEEAELFFQVQQIENEAVSSSKAQSAWIMLSRLFFFCLFFLINHSVYQELCKDGTEPQSIPQLLVDFWEALLVASSQESIIQELLFHLTSVYIERITCREHSGIKALKTAEDLVSSDHKFTLTRSDSCNMHCIYPAEAKTR